MTSSLTRFAAAAPEKEAIAWPPIVYGLITFALFMSLLALLWSFRNTAARLGQAQHDPDQRH